MACHKGCSIMVSPALVFGQSTGSMLFGSTKPSVNPQSTYFQRGFQTQAGRIAAQQTSKASSLKYVPWSQVARAVWDTVKWPITIGALGYSTIQTFLTPREEYGNRTLTEYSSYQYGKGLLEGEGEQYLANAISNEDELATAKAQAYQKTSPIYSQVAVENVWAEAEAKAQAYQAMQPYYDSTSSETQKTSTRMPYTPRVL